MNRQWFPIMKKRTTAGRQAGFTLIEMLTVIAIIGILAAIMVPVAGSAKKIALKRRAMTEMNSIKVAVMQFYTDHRYMPWPGDPNKVGDDKWTSDANQGGVMDLLTGNNPLKKTYLQIPTKSQGGGNSLLFVDPWGQPYQIGMDRNLDGAVEFGGKNVMEKVLVLSPGPAGENKPLRTFDEAN